MMERALKLLKLKLGITGSQKDERLLFLLESAIAECKKIQGLELDISNPYHLDFVIDLAAWRHSNKDGTKILPADLYFRLRNLMVGGKDGNI